MSKDKEILIIQNFGPIKDIKLELKKFNVLIGEQATGKSTIAKVLAVCRYFSYIVNFAINVKDNEQFNNNEQFFDGLKKWGIDTYLTGNSSITYSNSLYKFEFRNKLITEHESLVEKNDYETQTKIKSNNKLFSKLLNQLEELKTDTLDDNDFEYWTPNENFYRLNVKKVMNNPFYIPTERQYAEKDLLISDALQDELSKLNRIIKGFNFEIVIDPLSLTYKNQNGLGYFKKDNDKNYYALYLGASGYQSTIPIVLAVQFYKSIRFFSRNKTFIIEEPEQNLFPTAQKKLVEFLVKTINESKNQFLIPTHSPYILTTLSNLIYAHKIGTIEKGKYEDKVNEIIPQESWIDVKDISVYYLKDGIAENMVDEEGCTINLDALDDASEIINTEFDKLLTIEAQND